MIPPLKQSEIKRIKPILLKKHNHKCAQCGTKKNLQIDHVTARTLGGTNDIDNLQILCGGCNRKKGGRKSPGSPVRSRMKGTRKEVHLHKSIVELLMVGARRKGWSLKKYMENVLFRDSKKQVPYS